MTINNTTVASMGVVDCSIDGSNCFSGDGSDSAVKVCSCTAQCIVR